MVGLCHLFGEVAMTHQQMAQWLKQRGTLHWGVDKDIIEVSWTSKKNTHVKYTGMGVDSKDAIEMLYNYVRIAEKG